MTSGGKGFSYEACANGGILGASTCRKLQKGAFFNPQIHYKVAESGGYAGSRNKAIKVINILKELNLEVNERNFNAYRLQVAHNCPKWKRANLNFPELFT